MRTFLCGNVQNEKNLRLVDFSHSLSQTCFDRFPANGEAIEDSPCGGLLPEMTVCKIHFDVVYCQSCLSTTTKTMIDTF